MTDYVKNQEVLDRAIKRCQERGIVIPTMDQMRNPEKVPQKIRDELKKIGLWDVNPLNLFRITWKNEPVNSGGGFGGVNYVELPPVLTGLKSRIFILIGKFFPTGAHKVGATFVSLVDNLTRGTFDPTSQKALWPSTGNYCRGGAYDAELLGCKSIAVLPAGMSKERFEWLAKVKAEVIATPGCESNVKEIFDKVNELKEDPNIVVFNQFAEMSNPTWHYSVTGPAMQEVFESNKKENETLSAVCLTTGSAGTIGCGDYLKEQYRDLKIAAGEAAECPTMLNNGFGDHRIEGIGDKHIPWIHNVKNTDTVIAVKDEHPVSLLRLFNEPEGKKYLMDKGVPQELVDKLALFGISSCANFLLTLKMAKYYEYDETDVLFTISTDSSDMYQSRLQELREERGPYTREQAAVDYNQYILGQSLEGVLDCGHYDKKRIHNLKYYTWIEQQGMDGAELNAQWTDKTYWKKQLDRSTEIDEHIRDFNKKTGVQKKYE